MANFTSFKLLHDLLSESIMENKNEHKKILNKQFPYQALEFIFFKNFDK